MTNIEKLKELEDLVRKYLFAIKEKDYAYENKLSTSYLYTLEVANL